MVKISESELDTLKFKSWMCHFLLAGHLVSHEEYTVVASPKMGLDDPHLLVFMFMYSPH